MGPKAIQLESRKLLGVIGYGVFEVMSGNVDYGKFSTITELSATSDALVLPHGVNTIFSGFHAQGYGVGNGYHFRDQPGAFCLHSCARQEIVAEMIQVTVELEIFLSRGACAKIGKAINCILGKHNVEEVAEIIPSP